MDPVSPGRLWSLAPQGGLDKNVAPTSEDFLWICGNDPHLYHIAMIGHGGDGQVHKVFSFGDVTDS